MTRRRGPARRVPGPRILRAAVVLAVVVRIAVAGFLVLGPATDEVGELRGWDADRFQAIVERTGAAWRDEPVEYPPGSVVVLDLLAGDDVVATHRRLVALSVVIDLATGLALRRRVGRGPAGAYLLLGLPLVPMGYQRLDTLVTALAVLGGLAMLPHRSGSGDRTAGSDARATPTDHHAPGPAAPAVPLAEVVAATAIAAGALVKLWPVLLIPAAAAVGRWRAAIGAAVVGAAGGVAWLLQARAGLEPVEQIVSLRGATGWHVESLPGALVALVGDEPLRAELDAYRIGTLRPALVTAGRVLALAVMAVLTITAFRLRRRWKPASRRTLGLVMLGTTAALLATAPLLSPQFVLWLTPWAALLVATGDGATVPAPLPGCRTPVAMTAAAAILTGSTLHAFGPSGLAATAPALLLTVRNLLLVALPVACLLALRHRPDPGFVDPQRG